ncbi:SHOCT domain-containing protein [Microbacterium saperdae]
MPMRRFGRPGLIGLAARTAVVAGTATAVQGAVMKNQERRARGDYEQQQYVAAQQQAQIETAAREATSPYPSSPSPASAAGDDIIAKLQQLAALKDSGVLSDSEFTAAKQKLLS